MADEPQLAPDSTQGALPQDSPESTAAPTTAPPVPEPDLDQLLQDESFVARVVEHQRVKKEIEHRAKSIRDADVELRVQSRLSQLRAQDEAASNRKRAQDEAAREREQIKGMDEYELGVKVKSEQAKAEEDARAEAIGLAKVGQTLYDIVMSDSSLTDQERMDLHPLNNRFTTFQDFWNAAVSTVSKKQADKLAKELAKVEAEALYKERMAATREAAPSPAVLPPGGSVSDDKSFLAAYARGESNDHARARKLTNVRL